MPTRNVDGSWTTDDSSWGTFGRRSARINVPDVLLRPSYPRTQALSITMYRAANALDVVEYVTGNLVGNVPQDFNGSIGIRFANNADDIPFPHTIDWSSSEYNDYNGVRYYIMDVYRNLYILKTHDVVDDDGLPIPEALRPTSASPVQQKPKHKAKTGADVHHHVCPKCKAVSRCGKLVCKHYNRVKIRCSPCEVNYLVNATKKAKSITVPFTIGNEMAWTMPTGRGFFRSVTSPTYMTYRGLDSSNYIPVVDEYTEINDSVWNDIGELSNVTFTASPVTPANQGDTETYESRNETVPDVRPSSSGNTGDDWASLLRRL